MGLIHFNMPYFLILYLIFFNGLRHANLQISVLYFLERKIGGNREIDKDGCTIFSQLRLLSSYFRLEVKLRKLVI